MIDIDTNTEELEKALKDFQFKAWPHATKATLNDAAFNGRKVMQKNISRKMVERNQFTRKSVRVNKCTTLMVRNQESEFGSTQKYMLTQEDGGTERATGKHGLSIPTGYAAGQEGQRPRTRLPRKANRMQNIRLNRSKVKARSRKHRNFLLVRRAKEKGLKFVFMDLGRRKGVFKVMGSKRKPKIKMVADISHKIIRIKPTPTMKPAAHDSFVKMDRFYKENLIYQLRRWGLFND